MWSHPTRTPKAIVTKAEKLKLHRRHRFLLTGHPLLDAIRVRCWELRYTLTELDEFAETNRYFLRTRGTSGHVDRAKVRQAVEVLDGVLLKSGTIVWKPPGD